MKQKLIMIMMSVVLIVTIISCSSMVFTKHVSKLTLDDIYFCYERELWDILIENREDIRLFLDNDPQNEQLYEILESLASAEQDTLLYVQIVDEKVHSLQNLSDTFRVLSVLKSYNPDLLADKLAAYETIFTDNAERAMMHWQADIIDEEQMIAKIAPLETYPADFERYISRYINQIAVERSDSLRLAESRKFATDYPASEWQDLNRYMKLISFLNLEEYEQVFRLIVTDRSPSASRAYIYALMLQSPSLRKNYDFGMENNNLLRMSLDIIRNIDFPEDRETIKVLYANWDKEYWQNKLKLLEARAIYFTMIYQAEKYWGDEELIVSIDGYSEELYSYGLNVLDEVEFENNDFGEIAELNYWRGRYLVLSEERVRNEETAVPFIDALIAGAPNKRYDDSAFKYLLLLHKQQKIARDIMDWCRDIKNYQGPIFADVTDAAGFANFRGSRVAVADYNNNGYADILFNGRILYRNNQDFTFSDVTDAAGIVNYHFRGGLWADYNKNGLLDFAALSGAGKDDEPNGNKIYRNNGDGSFSVAEDVDINDYSPTEGAAWIDIHQTGYPSLYLANYEIWQERAGFEDYFWYNEQGTFIDKSEEWGFRTPSYTANPGLAGRGVSPADYNNDGKQSIFVSNYRLHRNLLWDYRDGKFTDSAPLNRVQGHLQQGYYGHTIGVDWGDYNNNGNLDLFMCNLAHPRFIEFSDISMLLRNDGPKERKIGDAVIEYHQFTDVTKDAGITFDELHSDPNWFDTNNNGFLDLFMTSIYENDRSYLYLNNGDGTFTDITFLSGTRVFNGWGNAVADFNNNGRMDLIVGSGSGVRLFKNITEKEYRSVAYKPYWDGDTVKIISREEWDESIPNSPAFGTRVNVVVELADGSEISLIRELNGGKGTTSQNDQYLHFGLSDGTLQEVKIWRPGE